MVRSGDWFIAIRHCLRTMRLSRQPKCCYGATVKEPTWRRTSATALRFMAVVPGLCYATRGQPFVQIELQVGPINRFHPRCWWQSPDRRTDCPGTPAAVVRLRASRMHYTNASARPDEGHAHGQWPPTRQRQSPSLSGSRLPSQAGWHLASRRWPHPPERVPTLVPRSRHATATFFSNGVQVT